MGVQEALSANPAQFVRVDGIATPVYVLTPSDYINAWFLPKDTLTPRALPVADVLAKPALGNGYAGAVILSPKSREVRDEALAGYLQAAVKATLPMAWEAGEKLLIWARPRDDATVETAFGLSYKRDTLRVATPLELPMGAGRSLSVAAKSRIEVADGGVMISPPDGEAALDLAPAPLAAAIQPDDTVLMPLAGGFAGVLCVTGQVRFPEVLQVFDEGFLTGYRDAAGGWVRQRYPGILRSEIRPPGVRHAMVLSVDPNERANDLIWENYTAAPPPVGSVTARSGLWMAAAGAVLPGAWKTRGDCVLMVGFQANAAFLPTVNQSGFAFYSPQSRAPEPDVLCLSLCGQAALTSQQHPDEVTPDIVAGFAGSETIAASVGADGAQLFVEFVPGQPGELLGFPYAAVSLDAPWQGGGGAPFGNALYTTWVRFVKRTEASAVTARYNTAPNGAPYFAAPPPPSRPAAPGRAAEQDAPETLLNAFDIAHGFDVTQALFPLMPYSGIPLEEGFALPLLISAEARAIAPCRVAAIRPLAAMPALRGASISTAATGVALGDGNATNPQGLILGVDQAAGNRIVDVTLGRSFQNAETLAGSVAPIGLTRPGAEVERLLKANQVFAVVVNPNPLGVPVSTYAEYNAENAKTPDKAIFRNAVAFASDADKNPRNAWVFKLKVGGNTELSDLRNVMILKYCDGALADLIANPSSWSAAGALSADPSLSRSIDTGLVLSGVAKWLLDYLADARERAEHGESQYQNFLDIADDRSWRGFLLLNADLSSDAIPEQLRGLSAGLRLDAFRAHHIGAAASRVILQKDDKQARYLRQDGPSSFFALINYEHPGWRANVLSGGDPDQVAPVADDGEYGFNVLQLNAVFTNGVMETFSSRIQLGINSFYATKVLGAYEKGPDEIGIELPASALILKGSYQTQGAVGAYSFSRETPVVFALDSTTLAAVSIGQVQFNTVDPGRDGADIVSRFRFWGKLGFGIVRAASGPDEIDILSYGPKAGAAGYGLGKGLAYSNIDLRLTSPSDTPNAVTFAFEAEGLSFSVDDSDLREGSLVRTLALGPKGYVSGGGGERRPEDLDLLPVRLDQIRSRAVEGDWFAVTYQVDMGAPGALAEAAGFDSTLSVAIAPLTSEGLQDSFAVWCGLQLPGTAPGAKLMSLQNVLKVSVASVSLNVEPVGRVAAEDEGARAFVLRLNNIGLSFMGLVNLPSGAAMNFFLFGEPRGDGSLGWFAAYVADPPEKGATVLPALEGLRQ